MGLTANGVANGFGGRLFGASQGAFAKDMFSLFNNAAMFGQITSVPQGNNKQTALRMTIKVGGNISARFVGEHDMIAGLSGSGNIAGLLDGEFDMVGAGNVAFNGYALFDGEFDMIAAMTALGSISANMDLLARPSANDIAQEVWNSKLIAYPTTGTFGKSLSNAESSAKLAAALSA